MYLHPAQPQYKVTSPMKATEFFQQAIQQARVLLTARQRIHQDEPSEWFSLGRKPVATVVTQLQSDDTYKITQF